MRDYTLENSFWKRLLSFVSNVQVNCAMAEEEKEMIIRACNIKLNNYINSIDNDREEGDRG